MYLYKKLGLYTIYCWGLFLCCMACTNSPSDRPNTAPIVVDSLSEQPPQHTVITAPTTPPGFDTLYQGNQPQVRDTLLDLLIENAGRDFLISPSLSATMPAHNSKASKVIHIFVALCDERYQGIAPTPRRIANGQAPESNLYWGAGYGIRNYFSRLSPNWKQVYSHKNEAPYKIAPDSKIILERCIFKHKSLDAYIVADAYDGRCIRETNVDFICAAAGQQADYLVHEGKLLTAGGQADLVAYIGHNGLMDIDINLLSQGELRCPNSLNKTAKAVIILACISKDYFKEIMRCANTRPLVWTKSLMGPEAYTIHDAIDGWLLNESDAQILDRALAAIAKYQKISIKAAKTILTSGY